MNLPKCKILYVLVSNKDSLYYEQALVSITSLKLHNPNAFVTLITDSITYETFSGFREGIKKIVNELKPSEYTPPPPVGRASGPPAHKRSGGPQ